MRGRGEGNLVLGDGVRLWEIIRTSYYFFSGEMRLWVGGVGNECAEEAFPVPLRKRKKEGKQ